MQPIYYIYVFLAFIGAGLVQTTTGFGSGIFVMVFLPLFLPVTNASSLSQLVSFFLTVAMAWRYRSHIRKEGIFLLAAANIAFSTLCIYLSAHAIDLSGLKAYLGLTLILVAIWMTFFSQKVKIRPNPGTALTCGTLSGILSGFFSIGGPPIVIYLLGSFGDDMLAYLATFQFFGIITGTVSIGMRAVNGTITSELLPLMLPGIAGIYLGMFVGNKIVDRIRVDQMKELIYGFLAASGLLTFITNM